VKHEELDAGSGVGRFSAVGRLTSELLRGIKQHPVSCASENMCGYTEGKEPFSCEIEFKISFLILPP
jgi:hypothetical protein